MVADLSDQLGTILDFLDASVAAGTLIGNGAGASGAKRLAALRNMLEAAGDLINSGYAVKACNQLLDALLRTDGVFPPPDFVSGTATSELVAQIRSLRAALGCEVQCGDVDRSGELTSADSAGVRKYLTATAPEPPFELERCSVNGGERECDILDAALLRRHEAGFAPQIGQVCRTAVQSLDP